MNRMSRIATGLAVICCLLGSAIAADTITGKVMNRTTGQPAVGDDVILLRLTEGMQEEAKTKTDSQGAFSLPITSPDVAHIVRVFHQDVNYDQRIVGKTPLEMNVFDASTKLPQVT